MNVLNCLPPELVQEGFFKSLAIYSHVIPVILLIIVWSGVVLAKHRSNQSRQGGISLLLFTTAFAFWMIGDLITWQATPSPIAAAWSNLDFFSLLFFSAGTYYVLKITGRKTAGYPTLILSIVPLPALALASLGKAMTGFDYISCEAIENPWLVDYRTFAEIFIIMFLLFTLIHRRAPDSPNKRRDFWLVAFPTLAFLATFAFFELSPDIFGSYDPFLYFLGTSPIFFAPLVYRTIRYELDRFSTIGITLLAGLLVILSLSAIFLATTRPEQIVATISLLLVTLVSWILISTVRREAKSRARAEELAENLETANVRLLELDKQKSEFVSLASHQLRGPLTAIKGYASMLVEGDYGKVGKDASEVLHRIQISSHDMARLITDYLDVSRIELGRMKYTTERFSMRDLVQEVAKEIAPNVPVDKVKLSINISDDPIDVVGDRNKLKQVVGNLIDNGIKYTPEGEVQVMLSRKNGKARFEVNDTGLGIPKTSLVSLFQKFARATNASKSNIRGTGLGLYIAKTIIDYHKGTISAKSDGEGRGSTFTFEIPLAA